MPEVDIYSIVIGAGILAYLTYQCYMLWKDAHIEHHHEK